MITQPTVFVLGAGVSVPFGFPTGKTVLSILTGNIGSPVDADEGNINISHRGLVSFMERAFGKNCMRELIKDLKSSMPPSIDTWLDYCPSHKELGRWVLAALILEYESRSLKHHFVSDNWFEWIFGQMMKGSPTLEQFLATDITFVTFNYDRLLERKFAKAIRAACLECHFS